MVKSFEHLSDAQLEQYGTDSFPGTSDDAPSIEAHLEDCDYCRSRVLEHQRARFAFLADSPMETGSKPGPAPSSACTMSGGSSINDDFSSSSDPSNSGGTSNPDGFSRSGGPSEDDLRNLAAGILSPDKALAMTHHVAKCAHCASILRTFSEDFADDLTPDEIKAENEMLAQLKSSSPKWQKDMARQAMKANRNAFANRSSTSASTSPTSSSIRSTSSNTSATSSGNRGDVRARAASVSTLHPARTSVWSLRWILAPAALAACAAIAFGIWFTQRDTPEKVEKLLAQAYTEQRTMEMRIPYAAHADFKQTRSGETTSMLSSPEALRKAADQIASNLKKKPNDPKWLMLQARLDILDWRYQAALSSLNRIDDEGMQNATQIEITKSLALFEKAEIEHDPQQYGDVIELLGKALQTYPDDPVTLFNHGLACEKVYMFVCSTTDFERLIKTEPDPGWKAEAEDHLKRIEEKKKPEQ